MSSTGSFGDGTWNDEGLFFTVVVHAGFALIFLLLILCLNGSERLKKILRPARPHSSGPRFATRADTAALFTRHENEAAMRVSVRAAVQLLLLKYRAFIFIGGVFSAVALTAVCGTDDFISRYAATNDVFDCKSRKDETACQNVGWCAWSNVTVGAVSVATCSPTRLEGLYDLTLLNLTPTHWRGWLVGLFNLLFHVWAAACIGCLIAEVRVLVFSSKTMPVQLCDTEPLSFKMGARAVRVPVVERQCRLFDGSAASLFPEAVAFAEKLLQKKEADKEAANSSARKTAPDNEEQAEQQPHDAEVFHRLLTKHAVAATVSYEPPVSAASDRTIAELIKVEAEIVDEMSDIVATERLNNGETATSCCGGSKMEAAEARLKEVRAEIEKLQAIGIKKRKKQLAKRQQQQQQSQQQGDGAGAAEEDTAAASAEKNPLGETYAPWKVTAPTHAFIVFDYSAHATRFLQLVEALAQQEETEALVSDSGSADDRVLLGPSSHLDHGKLTPSTGGSKCKTVTMFFLYIFLVLFGTSVVAFLGSVDRLASLPVISDIFGPVVRDMPTPLYRILQAYLPVIVLALFQLMLPPLVRSIVHSDYFRVPNWEIRDALSFRMIFVYLFVTGVLLQTALQGGLFALAAVVSRADLGDVLNFLTSMFAPKGGYFFALVASSTTFSQMMQLFSAGSVFGGLFSDPKQAVPEKRLTASKPRVYETDLYAALSMFIFSIGILYHTTSPLLSIFVCIYFISAYYCTRAVYLDVEDRSPRTNPASDASLSSELALSQVRYMLGLHTLATVGTFVVLCFKYLWGGAVLSAAALFTNGYLWHLKWTVLDPILDTKEDALIDHFDHMQGFFAGKRPPRPMRRQEEEQEQLEERYLPEFARYDGSDPWPERREQVLRSIESERGKKYEADDAPGPRSKQEEGDGEGDVDAADGAAAPPGNAPDLASN